MSEGAWSLGFSKRVTKFGSWFGILRVFRDGPGATQLKWRSVTF